MYLLIGAGVVVGIGLVTISAILTATAGQSEFESYADGR